jgi:hypothetical protein
MSITKQSKQILTNEYSKIQLDYLNEPKKHILNPKLNDLDSMNQS